MYKDHDDNLYLWSPAIIFIIDLEENCWFRKPSKTHNYFKFGLHNGISWDVTIKIVLNKE